MLDDQTHLNKLVFEYHSEHLLLPMQVIDGEQMSDLQRLSVLQHYGAATGLMDFTENALVALWFACVDEPEVDGKVFMVDIGDHQIARNARRPPELSDPFEAGSDVVYYEPDRSLGARIVAQQSVFVVCNPQIPDGHFHSVVVPLAAKEPTLEHLRQLGLSETVLFRDVPGLAAANTSQKPLQLKENLAPEQYRNRGDRAYQKGRYVHALAEYERYAKALPDVAQPHCLRGDALAALHRYSEAISAYTSAIENASQPLDLGREVRVNRETADRLMLHALHYNRGNAHAARGNHTKAIADYRSALEHGNRWHRNILFNCGNSKYALGRFQEAHVSFEAAWADISGADAALAMGNCKVLIGEFKEALRWYREGSGVGTPETMAVACRRNEEQLQRLLGALDGHEYRVRREEYVVYVEAACAAARFPIMGSRGNTGNVPSGMTTAPGGEGYGGMAGLAVDIVPSPPMAKRK